MISTENSSPYQSTTPGDLSGPRNEEEIRAEAAELLVRSPVDCIELKSNSDGSVDIGLIGDLADIVTLAASKDRPFDQSCLCV